MKKSKNKSFDEIMRHIVKVPKPKSMKDIKTSKKAKSDLPVLKSYNSGEEEKKELKKLADKNTPTRVIGLKLGRTEDSIRSQANKQKTSLKPTNQSPYDRKHSKKKSKKK